MADMIVTTTHEVQEKTITGCMGIVFGVRVDYEAIGAGSCTMLMVAASGTAARVS